MMEGLPPIKALNCKIFLSEINRRLGAVMYQPSWLAGLPINTNQIVKQLVKLKSLARATRSCHLFHINWLFTYFCSLKNFYWSPATFLSMIYAEIMQSANALALSWKQYRQYHSSNDDPQPILCEKIDWIILCIYYVSSKLATLLCELG